MIRRVREFVVRGRDEVGQMLVIMAGTFAVLVGLIGLSIDIGAVVQTKTDLQKMADAAAMAGGQDLPTASTATSSANTYVAKNGTGTATVTIYQTYSANDTIKVTVTRHVSYRFLSLLGLSGADPQATAVVRAGRYIGGKGLVPWGLIASNNSNSKLLQNSCYLGNDSAGWPLFKQNTQCILKYGAGTSSGGDFGALALDNTGGSTYRDNIIYGSHSSFKIGDQLEAQTGNMQGPTSQAISDLFAQPAPSTCAGNARDQVLKTNPDGSVSIREGCEDSPRIIIIPVVNQINNPSKSTLLGFAFMYLTGANTTGGAAQVSGEFVKFATEIPGGIYQGLDGNGALAVKLVQ
jgi:Flp pilus assembly protein TadG